MQGDNMHCPKCGKPVDSGWHLCVNGLSGFCGPEDSGSATGGAYTCPTCGLMVMLGAGHICKKEIGPFICSCKCELCGLVISAGHVHTCYGKFYPWPTSSYISPCDTCKLWDRCKKYRGCFEEKEEKPTGNFVKGNTWLDQTCDGCHKKGMTLWWDGPYYELRCDHCPAIYDVGRKMKPEKDDVKELIDAYEVYIELLTNEINDLLRMSSVHLYSPSRSSTAKEYKERIAKAKEKLK
jgi:hypothetical protein